MTHDKTQLAIFILSMLFGIGFGDIISGISGIAGLVGGFNQNQAANNAANAAADASQRTIALEEERQRKRDEWLARVAEQYQQYEQQGLFDFETRAQLVKNQEDGIRRDNLENFGATMKAAGYKPGDSVLQKGFAETEAIDTDRFYALMDRLQTQIPMEQFAMLNQLDPGRTDSGALTSALNNNANFNMGRAESIRANMGNPAELVAGLMPWLNTIGGKKKTLPTSGVSGGTNYDLLSDPLALAGGI